MKEKGVMKDFILGVGCTKGGTTWLYSQLNNSKNIDMGFKKEYHVFDALYEPSCEGFLTRKLSILNDTPHNFKSLSKKVDLLKHISFYLDTQNYYDYFDCLWSKGGDDVTTVGDITPSYSALPVEALREIKSNLVSRGFKVKVIFLMRDPIERIWSSVRMKRKKQLRTDPNIKLPSELTHVKRMFKTHQYEIRTRYEITVKNLEQVFDQDDIFYACYENLFVDQTLNDLKLFLNLSGLEFDVAHKVNVSKKDSSLLELDQGLASQIFNHYKDTYEFCESRFDSKKFWIGWKYS